MPEEGKVYRTIPQDPEKPRPITSDTALPAAPGAGHASEGAVYDRYRRSRTAGRLGTEPPDRGSGLQPPPAGKPPRRPDPHRRRSTQGARARLAPPDEAQRAHAVH